MIGQIHRRLTTSFDRLGIAFDDHRRRIALRNWMSLSPLRPGAAVSATPRLFLIPDP